MIGQDDFARFTQGALELLQHEGLAVNEFTQLIAIMHHEESRCETHELLDIGDRVVALGLGNRVSGSTIRRYFAFISEEIREAMNTLDISFGKVKVADDGLPVLVTVEVNGPDGSTLVARDIPEDTSGKLMKLIEEMAAEKGIELAPENSPFLRQDPYGNQTIVNQSFTGKTKEQIDTEADKFAAELDDLFPTAPTPDWAPPTVEGGEHDND